MTDIALPSTDRLGQGTAIEQSRAIAEVQAAVVIAQQFPRNVQAALRDMRESCGMMALAERAFFRFPRAGGAVSGPSVHLARELARCWGNIQYGIAELRRDDRAGQSEMLASAWDIQTNARSSSIFIVPHKRDQRGGAVDLTDMRDIYENNANAGARRVRECIFSVLPPWFVEEAKELCNKTIANGADSGSTGKPLPQRISDMLGGFERLGITEDDIARKLGRPSGKWTAADVAQMGVVFRSIQRGEVTREEEFPATGVTVAEIQRTSTSESAAVAATAAEEPSAPAPTVDEPRTETADAEQPTLPSDAAAEDPEGWPSTAQPGSGSKRTRGAR